MDEEIMSLEDVEAVIQARLDKLQARDDEGFERPAFGQWLECYQLLCQVKQAQALEKMTHLQAGILERLNEINTHPGLEALGDIANLLKGFKSTGFPVEHVG